MHSVWMITNPQSGSAGEAACEAIEAVATERGLHLAGRTRFPAEPLPTAEELAAAGVDTAMLFAGDGTINAALCRLAEWDGSFLILPGGTMNMLSKQLHGDSEPAAIVHRAHDGSRRVALPYVEAGPHRAFVGLIIGPAASWNRAREAVRARRLSRLVRAVRAAWTRTVGRGVRIAGAAGLRSRYQAVFVTPRPDGLAVAAVDARDWQAVAELGWAYLNGDWLAARAVQDVMVDRLQLAERHPVAALFDGERVSVPGDVVITTGHSARAFLATIGD